MIATLLESLRAFYRAETPASPDGRVVERDGVVAFVTPSAPTQSILNCVVFDRLDALAAALGPLARLYRDAGVTDWMVWTAPGEAAAAELLRDAGHRLDYEPMAMGLDLRRLRQPPDGPPFAVDRNAHPVEVTTLNERANGELPGAFGMAFAGLRGDAFHRYVARVGDRPAACLVTFDHGEDCLVQWVATDPEHQRRRLAGRLLHRALLDARERGMRSSTVESSYEGQRLYEGLGYAPLGRLGMWLAGELPPALS